MHRRFHGIYRLNFNSERIVTVEIIQTHKYIKQSICEMVWYGMVWYGMVWYGMVWYGMVWYGMVWYGMVGPTSHSTQYRSFRRRGALSSDVHLSFSNGGPAT